MLTSYLETVDPGNSTGWAEYYRGELKQCGPWDLDAWEFPCILIPDANWVIEDQVIYPKSPVPPNDIVILAKSAARVADRVGWKTVEWVRPRTWKSTLDADIMCERIIRCLTPTERLVYFAAADKMPEGVRHNVIDAIGIGLWKLRRLPK